MKRIRNGALVLSVFPLLALHGCGSGNGHRNLSPIITTPTPTATPLLPAPTGNLTPPFFNKVAFISRRGADETDQLYVMNPDGSQVTAIKPLSFGNFNLKSSGSHYMSADGSTFLFTFDFGTGAGTSNYLVNADGTNQRNITTLLDPVKGTAGFVGGVSMNANGTRLVFPSVAQTFSNNSLRSTASLFTMNADGSERMSRYTAPTDQDIVSPIFAPDGQTLYFLQGTTARTGNDFSYAGNVYRLAPGTDTPVLVTAYSLLDREADDFLQPEISVSADGTKLAFTNYVDGSSNEIFVVNTDGTGLVRLTNNTSVDQGASFTADGLKVIFVSYREGNAELYSINPDGTGETRLTFEIEPDTEPATRAQRKSGRKALLR